MKPIILSLFDLTGNAVRPWADAGWECWTVDVRHRNGIGDLDNGIRRVGVDVREFRLPEEIRPVFISAFPPCTDLAISGRAHFKRKGIRSVIEALELVACCVDLVCSLPCPFYIENPVGILSTHWRKPDHIFHPYEYAGYLRHIGEDAYTKKTCLWTGNGFVMPPKKPAPTACRKRIHHLPPGPKRANIRSETPRGFSKAVYLANRSRVR